MKRRYLPLNIPYLQLIGMQIGLSLYIEAETWVQDSHGLFDYESDHLVRDVFELRSSGHLERVDDSVQFLPLRPRNGHSALLAVQKTVDDRYSVAQCTEGESLWTVARYLQGPKKRLELTTDSVLKLGRMAFRIKEIGIGMETEQSRKYQVEETTGEEMVCRICYERQSSRENPLISPCICAGTVKYIHKTA